MRNLCCLAALAMIVGGPALAAEHAGFYFAGRGGPTFAYGTGFASPGGRLSEQEPSNVVGAFGMAAGYQWLNRSLPIRAELEFMNRTEMTYDASPLFNAGGGTDAALASTVQNVTGMLNLYVSPPWRDSKVVPFLSAGIGLARNRVKGDFTPKTAGAGKTGLDQSETDLAWSVGAGLAVELNRNVANDIQVRYLDLGGADWSIAGGDNVSMDTLHAIEISFDLRFRF